MKSISTFPARMALVAAFVLISAAVLVVTSPGKQPGSPGSALPTAIVTETQSAERGSTPFAVTPAFTETAQAQPTGVDSIQPAATPRPAPATDCTLFASPKGDEGDTGTSPSAPITLPEAADRAQPGSVVCLLPGIYPVDTSFALPHSGTSSAWIVYKSLDPNNPATITPGWGNFALFEIPVNVRYIEIRDLHFDGQNQANNGIYCNGGDHIRIIHNDFRYLGRAGIATYPDDRTGKGCDYLTIDHNSIFHNGYYKGWSSAISLDQNSWFDHYQGFHSYITNNIVSGEFDASNNHSDGNGIIIDNPDNPDSPPVLIASNVVYQNGGRCILALKTIGYWLVNNTCYKNGLDLAVSANNGEFVVSEGHDNYVVNNIGYAWGSRYPYHDNGSNNKYFRNLWFSSGSGQNQVPWRVSVDPVQLLQAAPLFVNPPPDNASAGGQYANAMDPVMIGNSFHPRTNSPAIERGIDPTTITGISSEIVAGLASYVYADIEGHSRPKGGPFDLGAYQHSP